MSALSPAHARLAENDTQMTQHQGGPETSPKRPIKGRIQAFLKAYAETCSITDAAKLSGVKRREHYRWLRRYPKYAAVFQETRQLAAEFLESELVRRATKGWLEPVFYQGKQCGSVRRFDGKTGMALLRGIWPEKYGINAQMKAQVQTPGVVTPVQPMVEVVYVSADDPATLPKRSQSGPSAYPIQKGCAAQAIPHDPAEDRPELLTRSILTRQHPPLPKHLRSWAL